jgi:hypothetical protein
VDHPPGLHWVLLEEDHEIKRKTYVGYDDQGHPRGAHVEQEVDPILEQNAITRSFNDGRKWGDYKPAASIPLTLFEKLGMQDAISSRDRRYISKVLNDGDYSKLRTSDGKV